MHYSFEDNCLPKDCSMMKRYKSCFLPFILIALYLAGIRLPNLFKISQLSGSNRRPAVYKTAARATELSWRKGTRAALPMNGKLETGLWLIGQWCISWLHYDSADYRERRALRSVYFNGWSTPPKCSKPRLGTDTL